MFYIINLEQHTKYKVLDPVRLLMLNSKYTFSMSYIHQLLFSWQTDATPLFWGSYYGNLDVVAPLLLCGANVNAQDKVHVCMYV